MASKFKPGRVTSPQFLQKVSPELLIRFLAKYKKFLLKEGAMPPSKVLIDYDKLSAVLAAPKEQMPPELLADLVYWDEISRMATDDHLRIVAEDNGIQIDETATLEEIALMLRMKAPAAIEDLYCGLNARGQLRKKKRFYSYASAVRPLPNWAKLTMQKIKSFEADMNKWYEDQKKGRGVRVLLADKGSSMWFIVRHGGTFKRENAIEQGKPTIVFYRPEDYDLLIYHHERGELEICNASNGKRERRAYCKNLGKNLFDDSGFFVSDDVPRYTLEPLRLGPDPMDCTDIDGIQSARLTDLDYRLAGENNYHVLHKAEDVSKGMTDQKTGIPEESILGSMTVKLTPDTAGATEDARERRVKIQAPNISLYDHENDATLARDFLVAKGFIRDGGDDEPICNHRVIADRIPDREPGAVADWVETYTPEEQRLYERNFDGS